MKKHITYTQWNELGLYNHAAKWLRPFCSYTLTKEGERFKREQRIPLWFYLIIFIPAHLAQALYCMWDGGLKEFEFAGRYLGGDYLGWEGDPTWEKAKKCGKGLDKSPFICYNEDTKRKEMKAMKKNKMTEKTMKEFAEWLELDYIYDSWTHEDFEDVTVYESRSANIICIRRDENGKVLEAWME